MHSSFYALSEHQILKLSRESKSTTATVDPAPTKLVLEFTDVLLPVFQKIVNLGLTSGTVPIAFKKTLIKKQNFDPEVLGNYSLTGPTNPVCPRVNFRSPRQRIVNGVCLLDKAN